MAFPACGAHHAAAALMPATTDAFGGGREQGSAKYAYACTAPASCKAARGRRQPWQPSLQLHAATLVCMLTSQVRLQGRHARRQPAAGHPGRTGGILLSLAALSHRDTCFTACNTDRASGTCLPHMNSLSSRPCLLQVLLVLTQGMSSGRLPAASLQPLRSVLLTAAPLLWVLWRPDAYWRCR